MTTIKSSKTAPVATANTFKAVFTNVDAMDKAIAKVVASSLKLQDEIQKVAVGIMLHAYHHGDYTRAQILVDGLGKGVRAKGLVEWFHQCGLDIDESTSTFSGFKKVVMVKKWDELKATMWYSLKPENPFQGFDLNTELVKLLKRAEAAQTKAAKFTQAGDMENAALVAVNPELLATLRAAAPVVQ